MMENPDEYGKKVHYAPKSPSITNEVARRMMLGEELPLTDKKLVENGFTATLNGTPRITVMRINASSVLLKFSLADGEGPELAFVMTPELNQGDCVTFTGLKVSGKFSVGS